MREQRHSSPRNCLAEVREPMKGNRMAGKEASQMARKRWHTADRSNAAAPTGVPRFKKEGKGAEGANYINKKYPPFLPLPSIGILHHYTVILLVTAVILLQRICNSPV